MPHPIIYLYAFPALLVVLILLHKAAGWISAAAELLAV